MNNIIYSILVVILALNLFALGNHSIRGVIRMIAIQGVLLGSLPLILEREIAFSVVISSLLAISLKGFIIPIIMLRALKNAKIKNEVQPLIGFLPSILIGAFVTALVFLISKQFLVSGTQLERMIIPASFTTILIGFIILVTRYKAITQVMGYMVLENGIYIFSLLLVVAIPLVVEMGMLLDLFVSVFIISIITNHINEAFSSLDTRKLTSLKEEK